MLRQEEQEELWFGPRSLPLCNRLRTRQSNTEKNLSENKTESNINLVAILYLKIRWNEGVYAGSWAATAGVTLSALGLMWQLLTGADCRRVGL